MYSDEEILSLAVYYAAQIETDPAQADPETAGLLGSDVVSITNPGLAAHDSHVATAVTLLHYALGLADDHPYHATWMFDLGTAYGLRAERASDTGDWDVAVSWMDQAIRHTLSQGPADATADIPFDELVEDLAVRLAWAHHHRSVTRIETLDKSDVDGIDGEARACVEATEWLVWHVRSVEHRAVITALVGLGWAWRHTATNDAGALAIAIETLSSSVADLPPDDFAAAAYEVLAELLGTSYLSPDGSTEDSDTVDRSITAAVRSIELSTPEDPNWAYRHWLEGMHRDTRLNRADKPDPHDRDRLIDCLTIALDARVEPDTAFTLGHRLAERGAANNDTGDLLAGIRWLRVSATTEEAPTRFTWLTWAELMTAYDALGRLTGAAEEWAQVIACATMALECDLPGPEAALELIFNRLVTLHDHAGGDAKAAVAAFPVAQWIEEDTTTIMAAAGDPDLDSDVVAMCAGHHALADMWLMSELVTLTSTAQLAQFVERIRPLVTLGLNITEPPLEDWEPIMNAVSDVVDMVDHTVVQDSAYPPFDRLINSAKSAVDTDLRDRFTELTTVMSGLRGTQTGHLASMRVASRGMRRQETSQGVKPQDADEFEAMGQLFEFFHLAMARPGDATLTTELDKLTESIPRFSHPQSVNIIMPFLIMAKNMMAVLQTGELAETGTAAPPAQPGDPWYPFWRLTDLVPRLVKAKRDGSIAAARRIGDEINDLRHTGDPQQDVVRTVVDMVFSMADAELGTLDLADRRQLDLAIEGQQRTLERFRSEPSSQVDLFATSLARLLRQRGDRGDLTRSRELAMETVAAITWRVLVQSGTTDAITIARDAAAEMDLFLTWCVADNALDDLVRVLDAQRCLVLHAANTNRSVARQLVAAGEQALAAKWIAAAGDERVDLPGMSGIDALPTDLRSRVLRTLSTPAKHSRGSLLHPPGIPEIQHALATHGSDVLIYLVPATPQRPGMAVAVPRDSHPDVSVLNLLETGPHSPIGRYVQAYTRWQDSRGEERPAARENWRAALNGLCDWAWDAAGAEILRLARRHAPAGRLPRIVLTPMGMLGMVPWHAARHTGGAGPRYLLHDVCVSYTPSARMLCEVTARPPVVDGDTVLVGDPAENLYLGGLEAKALQESFYPEATFLGGIGETDSLFALREPAPDGAGTPSEVTALLLKELAMIHFACHAKARVNAPHESYVQLAGPSHECNLAAGTLLDLNPTDGLRIGLVNLAGCTTSLSGVDYDEALSLSSTFLAIGARSVLGSLWSVPGDRNTVYLTYQTNRYLAEGMPIADALRCAQLWMLDPDHQDLEAMPDTISRLSGTEVSQEDVSQWAAFLHMGV